jgi:hypothetical protein
MEPQRLLVEPREWPSRDNALVFLWKTARDPNLVRDPLTKVPHTWELEPRRKARLDHHHAMVVSDGYFRILDFGRLASTFRSASAVTVETTIQPATLEPKIDRELAEIVSLSPGEDTLSFALGQRGDELVACVGTPLDAAPECEPVMVGRLSTSEPTHVVVSYRPGQLVGYVNGESVLDTDAVQGGLSSWSTEDRLQFGMGHGSLSNWDGTIEGVAIYSRFMGPAEASANARAYLDLIAEREPVERIEIRGKLVGRSHVPTVGEIVPYREALVMYEYEVLEVLDGELGDEILRVAHWAILGGRLQSAAEREVGDEDRLALEPFDRNPQIENTYLSDTLELRLDVPVFFDVDP